MEDNFLIYLLIIILGNDIAKYVIKNNRKIRIPFFLIYLIIFGSAYTVALIFLSLISMIHQHDISWKGIGLFSIGVSVSVVLILFILDKIKK